MELNQFDWINWIGKPNKKEIKDGFGFPKRLNQFEEFFFKENKSDFRTSTRKTTWRSSYKPYMKRILSEVVLLSVLINQAKGFWKTGKGVLIISGSEKRLSKNGPTSVMRSGLLNSLVRRLFYPFKIYEDWKSTLKTSLYGQLYK